MPGRVYSFWFDEALIGAVDEMAAERQLTRSALVREALQREVAESGDRREMI